MNCATERKVVFEKIPSESRTSDNQDVCEVFSGEKFEAESCDVTEMFSSCLSFLSFSQY